MKKVVLFFFAYLFAACNLNSGNKENLKTKKNSAPSKDSVWTEGTLEYSITVMSDGKTLYSVVEHDSIASKNGVTAYVSRWKDLNSTDTAWSRWEIENIRHKTSGLYIHPHSDQDLQQSHIRNIYKVGDTVDVPVSFGEPTVEKNFIGSAYVPIRIFKEKFEILPAAAPERYSYEDTAAKNYLEWLHKHKASIELLIKASADTRIKDLKINSPWML